MRGILGTVLQKIVIVFFIVLLFVSINIEHHFDSIILDIYVYIYIYIYIDIYIYLYI